MTIQIEYEAEREWEIDYRPIIEEIVVAALDYEKCPYEAEVNVVLTNDEEIHRINKEFRGIDRATDVLSFPMGDYDVPSDFERLEEQSEDYFNPETGELLLGDIVISIDIALPHCRGIQTFCFRRATSFASREKKEP